MPRYAVIDSEGKVANVVIWDGNADPDNGGWAPPEGMEMVEETDATGQALIGGDWSGSTFGAPPDDLDYFADVPYPEEQP